MKVLKTANLILGVSILVIGSVSIAQETDNKKDTRAPMVVHDKNPYPSTYEPWPSVMTAIINVHILVGNGGEIEKGTVIMDGGKIIAVGENIPIPSGANLLTGMENG